MNYSKAKQFILAKLDGLPDRLTYHNKQHTLDVLKTIEGLIESENVDDANANLLKVAALMHDSGFLEVYTNHEGKGCEYAKEWLPQFGYSKNDISQICGMVMATKIPHTPKNKFEQFLCDADLDYLGTDDYDKISATLYQEWVYYGLVNSKDEWLDKQIGFLKMHRYFTHSVKNGRIEKKVEVLERLQSLKAAILPL